MTCPTLIDLFAGCGGLTSGFVSEGFSPVAAVEFDRNAAATYAANFGQDHTQLVDISDWHDIPSADVVVGGPPCQGFSSLGTQQPDDPRNTLWREYVRVLIAAKPKVFVIENVDRFLKSYEYKLLEGEVRDGQLRDYQIVSAVLNAADYGVPQRRKRTIIVGSLNQTPHLPEPTHGSAASSEWTTLRSILKDVPWETETTSLPVSSTPFLGSEVPGTFKGMDIHVGRNPTQLSLQRYDHVPPGGGRFDLPQELLPDCWKNKPTGTTDVMGRLEWDKPSVTIRTEFFKPEKGKCLHPQWDPENPANRVNRPITHLEAALIQTFPKDYLWCGSKVSIAKQIGNAVPPLLARQIAKTVASLL